MPQLSYCCIFFPLLKTNPRTPLAFNSWLWFILSFHSVTLFYLFYYRENNVSWYLHMFLKYKSLSVSAISHCIVRSSKFSFFLKFNYLVLSYYSLPPIDMSNFIYFTYLLCVFPLMLITVAGVRAYLLLILKM